MIHFLNDINIHLATSLPHVNEFVNIKKTENKTLVLSTLVIFAILSFIQYTITVYESPSKRVSKSLIVRNVITAILCGYSVAKYGSDIFMFVLFFIASLIIHLVLTIIEAKTLTTPIDDYVTTTYLYDIYFPKLYNSAKNEKIKKTLINYSEGLFTKDAIAFDLDDTSPENVNRVYAYIEETYKNKTKEFFDAEQEENPNMTIKLPNNQNSDILKLESDSQSKKFDWFLSFIPENTNKDNYRILELGFGEGGFLRHARSRGFKNIVGVNISQEQVDNAAKDGFEVYCKNYWDLNEMNLKPFDYIFTNGTIEHCVPKTVNTIFASDDAESNKYGELYKIINKNLKPNGLLCTTLIHVSPDYKLPFDDFNFWSLWLGNSGNYPSDASTKKALSDSGFTPIEYKDATLHYAYWSFLWAMCANSSREMSFLDAFRLSFACPFYIFSQLCYSSVPRIFGYENVFKYHGWLQHFVPKKENGTWKYGTQLANHRWIVSKKV
jgi:cyclopropane fatty-acyl-phospholipid synthase-like methyltransferase